MNNRPAWVPAAAQHLGEAKNSVAEWKMERVGLLFWRRLYCSSYPRPLPHSSAPTPSNQFGAFSRSCAIRGGHLRQPTYWRTRVFPGIHNSTVRDSSGGLWAKPDAGEFAARLPQFHDIGCQSRFHRSRPPIAAPIFKQCPPK